MKITHSKIKNFIGGLVFTGEYDGRVVLIYDHKAIAPISYAYPDATAKKEALLDWKNIGSLSCNI